MLAMSTQPEPEDLSWADECECLHPKAVMAARVAVGDAEPLDRLARMFSLLADQTRLRVLAALASGELCVTDLAAATGINRTTISHQLKVLREERLVKRRRNGKVVYYALDDHHVTSVLALASSHIAEEAEQVEVTA